MSKTKKVFVKRRMKGYSYKDGEVIEMPADHADLFLEKEFAVSPKDAPEPEKAPETNDLPEDLPGRDALIDAGHKHYDALFNINDFRNITGIGKATEKKIVKYLEKNPVE